MNIKEIISTNANVQLVVSATDLKELFLEWHAESQSKIKEAQADELLTESDVKAMLGVAHSTLYHWRKSGYLTSQKIGRKNYYRRSQIEKLLNKKIGE